MIFFVFLYLNILISNPTDFLEVKAKSGDGLITLFQRYDIDYSNQNISLFKELNNQNNLGLNLSKTYKLPINVYKFNGKSIRTTINNNDYDFALAIQHYNEDLVKKGIKDKDFREDKILWVPVNFNPNNSDKSEKIALKKEIPLRERVYPILGKKYEKVKEEDHLLLDCAFYLITGHGGPDPGAQSEKGGHTLSEDEYAYDVILRLGRELIKRGAEVYFIVQDPEDGIRDEVYLKNSKDEFYYGGKKIDYNQKQRLHDRCDITNEIYNQNPEKKKNHHAISIHVDSRLSNSKQIDIFFYYAPNSSEGELIANSLLTTIKRKYNEVQPNRGYEGSVSYRSLYVLRHIVPVMTFIELGNIQNYRDQQRILIYDNRQAIANWLTDGLVEYYKSK